jgi:hypothetical protein
MANQSTEPNLPNKRIQMDVIRNIIGGGPIPPGCEAEEYIKSGLDEDHDTRKITFNKIEIVEALDFTPSSLNNQKSDYLSNIVFKDCKLKTVIYVKNSIGSIAFENTEILGDLIIKNSFVKDISLRNSKVQKSVQITNDSKVGNIVINKECLLNRITVDSESNIGNLSIQKST